MDDIERAGEFYLGREYDLAAGAVGDRPVLYDSRNLTTHAVCVGMTGSGKTGLCISLLEEAALDGVPAIAIDPKGDLGNLLLAFPELRAEDFRPWIDESEATRKGITPEALAEQTAAKWKSGLSDWGEDGARIRRYCEAVDRVVYTPGSSAGAPLTVLKSFGTPPREILEDGDALRDRIDAAATGVLGLLGLDVDPVNSREHILLAKVLETAWLGGRDLDLEGLIRAIQKPPFERVGVSDLESFYPASERHELGMKLNNLLASPAFAAWLEGEPLDIQRLLYTAEGKPRLSIVSISHLGDAERMFFVTMLLNELISWMRSQSGTSSLRAILYMDEVFGYFPPVANPPSKRPMLTLMKQARAYGVGCVLATQNPVDLDYKGLSNAGTWLLGRLQTERDKRRVIEGLQGASAEAGAAFDQAAMERTLSALDTRVFLMHNVHAAGPTVFHSRWALSYLAGPLTRSQIATLMRERKGTNAAAAPSGVKSAAPTSEAASSKKASVSAGGGDSQPMLSAEIKQRYWPVDGETQPGAGERLLYRPALLGLAKLHFVKAADDIDVWQELTVLQSVHGELPKPPWDSAMVFETRPHLSEGPVAGATFAELPSELAQAKNYRRLDNELADQLYQQQRLKLWKCTSLEALSRPGETEEEFRSRAADMARERLTARRDKVLEKFSLRIKRQEEKLARAEAKASEQRSQFWIQVAAAIGRVFEVVLTLLAGRRSRKQLTTSAKTTMRERGQSTRATDQVAAERAALEQLRSEEQAELDQLDAELKPEKLELEEFVLPARKSDIAVDEVLLAWTPWRVNAAGEARPAY